MRQQMDGISELFNFVGSLGEEISNIFTGEGMVTEPYIPVRVVLARC